MSNGNLWTAKINYNGAALSVNVTDPAEGSSFTAISQHPIDIASYLGTNSAYVGFTSGTGAGWENHDIVNWEFANTATLPTTPTPEPSSVMLLGVSVLALGGLVWRRSRPV